MDIEFFLKYFQNVKTSGAGWSVRCPAHDDQCNSLSVKVGDDGRFLLKCHAGCRVEEILEVLQLGWPDLFPNSRRKVRPPINVEELAFDKCLPEEFLRSLGIEEKERWVRISYYLSDGTLASRQRKRWALSAKLGSAWEKGEGSPMLYGLWKLKEAKQAGTLIFVEGESDCWTLWYHKFHALGLPGADMAKKIEFEHISGLKKIYLVQEPDKGGETFVKGIRKRLSDLGYKGLLFVIEMRVAKDPNELHQRSSNFQKDFQKLIAQAKPLSLVESVIIVDYGPLIPKLPEPQNKTVLELLQEAVAEGKTFAILAPQGSGKSYANSFVAVLELKKGRSVIIASRSHDELNQMGQTIKSFLREAGIPEYHLFHLKGGFQAEDENSYSKKIPDVRPIIVIAPHVYFQFKGETPYHHKLAEMLFQGEFGERPLVLIDEFVSFLEAVFLSKELGSRNTLKKVFGEELWIKNSLCPLFTRSGNCLNCHGSMFLQPRRGQGGMLCFLPVAQHHKDDKLKKEAVEMNNLVQWDECVDDNTMRVYPFIPHQTFPTRQWSTGGKDEQQLDVNLKSWFADVRTRMIETSLVFFYPYDSENGKNLGRPLTETELNERKKGRRIAPPRHVCGVPILQGWDLAILRKIQENAQIGFSGPGASDADRYVLHNAFGEIRYHIAQFPYVRFQKLLIVSIEKELPFDHKETQDLIRSWTQCTKVLSFHPTYYEAANAENDISEKVRTMYYDGAQKIRNAPIAGTSIEFDLCISCIHGPLGQGLDLGQFKIALVSTSCERPKCLFVGRPDIKSNKEYIVDDLAEKSRQAAMRILRLTADEDATAPRVVVFYGRYALEVSHRVETALTQVGHVVKVVNAQTCIRYTQELTLRWLKGIAVNDLENAGVAQYEENQIMGEAKAAITGYLKEHPDAEWRELVSGPQVIRDLPAVYKQQIKSWFQEQTAASKQQDKYQKMAEKIREYQKENPKAQWPEIRRKFHVDRKTKEEEEMIKQHLGL